ncbi:hypothetical protein B0T17DRAFT_16017 [Bombardia bombarda]|uniref:Uncharacterized protein n=1 Tax=Bombardia bombarda TaxID=252184 RepID=A0AA39XIN8_9PEZI|nr:hypothetical protein B0T17DRAFT_16017 [Bombardia bombarda]
MSICSDSDDGRESPPPCTVLSIKQMEQDLGDFTRGVDFSMARGRVASSATGAPGQEQARQAEIQEKPTRLRRNRNPIYPLDKSHHHAPPPHVAQSLAPGADHLAFERAMVTRNRQASVDVPQSRGRNGVGGGESASAVQEQPLRAWSPFPRIVRSNSNKPLPPCPSTSLPRKQAPPSRPSSSSRSVSRSLSRPRTPSFTAAEFSLYGLPPLGKGMRDHLAPDPGYVYQSPPPFFHNWESPNRRSASKCIDPRRARHRVKNFACKPVGSIARPKILVSVPVPATAIFTIPITTTTPATPSRREAGSDLREQYVIDGGHRPRTSSNARHGQQQGSRGIPRFYEPGGGGRQQQQQQQQQHQQHQRRPAMHSVASSAPALVPIFPSSFRYAPTMSPHEAEAASKVTMSKSRSDLN